MSVDAELFREALNAYCLKQGWVSRKNASHGSPSELQKRLGKTVSFWSDLLRGKKSFSSDLAREIEAGLRMGKYALDMDHEIGLPPQPLPVNTEAAPPINKKRMYPLISDVQAGDWTEICDNFQPGDADEWRESHKDLGRCGFVLRVTGDSMTGAAGSEYSFPAGFLLYVNPDMDALPGKFVIVRREGDTKATFKRYVMLDGEQYLEALNPMWPNRYIKLREGDVFCGVVVHAGRDLP